MNEIVRGEQLETPTEPVTDTKLETKVVSDQLEVAESGLEAQDASVVLGNELCESCARCMDPHFVELCGTNIAQLRTTMTGFDSVFQSEAGPGWGQEGIDNTVLSVVQSAPLRQAA
jgi:hypothetical protein